MLSSSQHFFSCLILILLVACASNSTTRIVHYSYPSCWAAWAMENCVCWHTNVREVWSMDGWAQARVRGWSKKGKMYGDICRKKLNTCHSITMGFTHTSKASMTFQNKPLLTLGACFATMKETLIKRKSCWLRRSTFHLIKCNEFHGKRCVPHFISTFRISSQLRKCWNFFYSSRDWNDSETKHFLTCDFHLPNKNQAVFMG